MSEATLRKDKVTNGLFHAAFTLVRILRARLRTTGVCTLVVPKTKNYAFLLRIFKILGAEGGLISNTVFLPFLLGILIFLGKLQFWDSALTAPSNFKVLLGRTHS